MDYKYRAIMSTPSRFVGEYRNNRYEITHLWQFNDMEGLPIGIQNTPYNRNYFVLTITLSNPKKDSEKKKKSYFGGGDSIALSIMSLMAVLFGKRFDFHGSLQLGSFLAKPDFSNIAPISTYERDFNNLKQRNDTNIKLNLDEIQKLNRVITHINRKTRPIYHGVFINATKFYLRAIQNHENNPDLAYIDLITAGEIITDSMRLNIEKLYDEDIKYGMKQLKKVDVKAHNIVKSRLMFIRKRFVQGLTGLLDQSYYKGSEKTFISWRITLENINKCLNNSYVIRSKMVHEGLELGEVLKHDNFEAEKLGVIPMPITNELKKLLSDSLSFYGLERLIRYCLLKYAKVI